MQVAQRLYQGIEIEGETIGLITYMRTDSVNISADFIKDLREFIRKGFGDNYIPKNVNSFQSKLRMLKRLTKPLGQLPYNIALSPLSLILTRLNLKFMN